jgi:hypothetical protein
VWTGHGRCSSPPRPTASTATGFGAQTTTLALVLLPVALFLSIAAHGRLVAINREEVELVLAMNRLRHAYLAIAPGLEPYFTTGHHDDEQGLAASYVAGGRRLRRWGQFLIVWAALFSQQRHALDPLSRTPPRFTTPPDEA